MESGLYMIGAILCVLRIQAAQDCEFLEPTFLVMYSVYLH